MSLFAIPGLMIPPVSKKSNTRLTANADGTVRATLYTAPRADQRVKLTVVRVACGDRYQKIIDDPHGAQLIRVKTTGGFAYVWRYDRLSPPLPDGDLELWLDHPEGRLVYSLYVKKPIFTEDGYAFDGVSSTLEYDFGIADIPVGQATFRIPYSFRFSRQPVRVAISRLGASGTDPVEYVTMNVQAYDQSSLLVSMSSALTQPGSRVSWSVSTGELTRNAEHQDGQAVFHTGADQIRIQFPFEFAELPVVIGSMISAVAADHSEVYRHMIHNISTSAFTVLLSSEIPAGAVPALFNWEAHLPVTGVTGRVTIPAGNTSASVSFSPPLVATPKILGALQSTDGNEVEVFDYIVEDPSASGFRVRVPQAPTTDLVFHWRVRT